ncbi:MAG: hypothetical protein V1739_00560 [Candidatus Omnitrophota bacterium]
MRKKIFKIFSLGKIISILFVVFVLLIVSGLFIARFHLSSYRFFSDRRLVAIVECEHLKKSSGPVLNVEFFPGSKEAQKRTFLFNADEWVIESRIVQWKSFFGITGARSYFQLERLSGRYLDIEKEKTMPRIVYALSSPDKIWEVLYKFQKLIPFIEAVYGNSAFVRFEAGKKFHVYVTNSGLMIKDMTQPKKRSFWFIG